MPGGRQKLDLAPYKDFLLERLTAGKSHAAILKDLETEHSVKCSISTFHRNLHEWGVKTKRDKWEDSEQLRSRVAYCFHELRLTDAQTYKKLEEEGFDVGKARLAKLRKEMGLFKRCPSRDEELAEGAIAKALLQEIKNGGIEQMGRRQLYEYLRAKYNVVGRDRIYKIAALFDPDGPRRRKAENGRKTGKMRKAQREALADQETMQTAVNMLQQPQMPLPSYPPPPGQMPLHYGI